MLRRFRTALDRFPDHPYAVMMSYMVASGDGSLTPEQLKHYVAVYENTVRRQLRESESYRPGFRESPPILADGPVVPTPDGSLTTSLPGVDNGNTGAVADTWDWNAGTVNEVSVKVNADATLSATRTRVETTNYVDTS